MTGREPTPSGAFIVVNEIGSPREVAGDAGRTTRQAMKWRDLRPVNVRQPQSGLKLFYGVVEPAKASKGSAR